MNWEVVIKEPFGRGSEEDIESLLEIIMQLEKFKTIDYSGKKNVALEALREFRKEIKSSLRFQQ